ncbi:hypothetical protein D7S65_26645 [Ralstonia insidiosa]|nr:hypothetical protein [Ralstonia insidiosa]MBA9872754.1 hypothetical protein [Ralstonia insidiosa]MBA9915956.1 hypothetical protein [Ralstonia insidiosa]MBA9939498.1 hypothetical protein [Ralstonia insidiosa]MBA9954941.1 hypothetical protein [Ralstonia insidiosa]
MSPSPPGHGNSRSGSPHRARLSLLTFFGKTKKVSRPRQGTKHQRTTTASKPDPRPQNAGAALASTFTQPVA